MFFFLRARTVVVPIRLLPCKTDRSDSYGVRHYCSGRLDAPSGTVQLRRQAGVRANAVRGVLRNGIDMAPISVRPAMAQTGRNLRLDSTTTRCWGPDPVARHFDL